MCALITLALGAQAIQQSHYPKASMFFQSTAHFMTQVLEQSTPVPADGPPPAFKRIDFQLRKYLAMSQLAMLAHDIEQRREKRIMDRLEAHAKGMSTSSVAAVATAATPAGAVTSETTNPNESTAEVTTTAPKEEEQDEDEAMIMEICKLLSQYLTAFGPMDTNLQVKKMERNKEFGKPVSSISFQRRLKQYFFECVDSFAVSPFVSMQKNGILSHRTVDNR